MVVIRLSRAGAKKRPFFHIVVSDRRFSRDGRYLQRLGYYNPIAAGQETRLHLDYERAQYWISKGAQPSQRVKKLLSIFVKDAAKTAETPAHSTT